MINLFKKKNPITEAMKELEDKEKEIYFEINPKPSWRWEDFAGWPLTLIFWSIVSMIAVWFWFR